MHVKSAKNKPETMPFTTGKVIILTGASRGIGLAIAQYLLQLSNKLVIVARSIEPLDAIKRQFPGQVELVAADVTDFSVCGSLLPICDHWYQF